MRIFFIVLFGFMLCNMTAQTSYEFYVSPDGDDSNTGLTTASPFASLEKARDEVQGITGNAAITVWLMDGDYYRNQSFELNAADSGSPTKTITYKAQNRHKAKLHLTREILASDFQEVTDPALVSRLRPRGRRKSKNARSFFHGLDQYQYLAKCVLCCQSRTH